MAKIINLLEYRDSTKKSADGIWTQGRLIDKIRMIVHRVNISQDTDEDIAKFIEESFAINGIIDTYNQLGYAGWYQMILMMAEHEVFMRKADVKCT